MMELCRNNSLCVNRASLPKKVTENSGLLDKEIKVTTKNNKIVIEEDKDEKEKN